MLGDFISLFDRGIGVFQTILLSRQSNMRPLTLMVEGRWEDLSFDKY